MPSCRISFLYKTLIAIYIYLIENELLHILIMLLLKWLFYPFIEIQYSLYVNFISLKFTLWCVTCILNSFICSYTVFFIVSHTNQFVWLQKNTQTDKMKNYKRVICVPNTHRNGSVFLTQKITSSSQKLFLNACLKYSLTSFWLLYPSHIFILIYQIQSLHD